MSFFLPKYKVALKDLRISSSPQLDLRTTDDKFCLAFDKHDVTESDARSFFQETGAEEVNTKNI